MYHVHKPTHAETSKALSLTLHLVLWSSNAQSVLPGSFVPLHRSRFGAGPTDAYRILHISCSQVPVVQHICEKNSSGHNKVKHGSRRPEYRDGQLLNTSSFSQILI
jgi:hypothetical protein